jgi:hypothetical protein
MCTVCVLVLLIGILLAICVLLQRNVDFYYEMASPYVMEMARRSLDTVAHIQYASANLDTIMNSTRDATAASLPRLVESVNATNQIVERFQHITHTPTIKLSLA